MYDIILASASPRRQALLKQIGLDFRVNVSQAEESYDSSLAPYQVVEILSQRKARAVYESCGIKKDTVIIAADTIVAAENKILGKPENEMEAEKMLISLSGKMHCVYTGVTMLFIKNNKPYVHTFNDCAKVYFRTLTPQEIKAYIATGEPMDKAGAYGIQEKGAVLVEKIEGDFYTIVGLPIVKVYTALNKY